jgi:transposase
MRFYIKQHAYYCGIDLHARSMYLCVLDQTGTVVLHRNMPADPAALLDALAPFRPDVVVAAECTFSWYWVADLCADQNIPFILGHALYMKAIHGAKAKNDRIDSYKIAALVRGGNFPLAHVYPKARRATRDLLRRRTRLVRQRAELSVHIQNTTSQYNLPPLQKRLSYRCNRDGIAERFLDPSARKSVELDLALMEVYDQRILDLERHILNTAKEHDGDVLYRLQSVQGIGKILALTIHYEVGDIARFPTVQDFASYARLVKPSKESAGRVHGHGGGKIGNAHLKWSFSEAAVLFLRDNPAGQKLLARYERKHGKPKALSILAHRLGRAVYYILKRKTVFDMQQFIAS